MAYKVFISHSVKDMDFVNELSILLEEHSGVKPYVAAYDPQPGEKLSQKIKENIYDSQFVIALLTRDGMRSQWVNQEIGYANKAGKKIIPIVEKGVKVKGFLEDIEYISFDRNRPYGAIDEVLLFAKSEKRKMVIDTAIILGIAVGIIGFLMWLESKNNR